MKLDKLNNIIKALEIQSNNNLADSIKSLELMKGQLATPEQVAQTLMSNEAFLEMVKGEQGDTPSEDDVMPLVESCVEACMPVKGVDYFDGEDAEPIEPIEVAKLIMKDKKFIKSISIPGKDGYTPIKGTDYFTEDEVKSIETNVEESLLPKLETKIEETIDEKIVDSKQDLSEYLRGDQAESLVKMAVMNGGTSVLDGGNKVGTYHNVNFIGATVTPRAGRVDVEITGSGSGHIIQEQGTSLTQRSKLNFVGATVTATDDLGNDASVVTISSDLSDYTNDAGFLTAIPDDYLLNTGDTGTGAYDFGGATTFEIPNSAAPTLNATGQIAVDTTVTDFTNGLLKYYSTAEYGVVAMPIASFSAPTNGYVVAYNSTNDAFELVAQSGGGGGITIGTTTITSGTDTRILFDDGGVVGEDAGLVFNKTQNKLSIVGSSTVNISSPATSSIYTGAYPASITSGINITAYGIGAANSATSATSIVAIGTNACNTITTALFTIGIGALAFQNASPTRGVAVGASAQANNTGTDAFSFGNLSMGSATSESFSLVAGTNAGSGMTVGFWNNGIGGSIFAANGAAYGNTGMGHASGQTVGGSFGANRNTFYGYASDIAAGVTGAMALGAGATALTSNTIVIGGTVTAPTRVYFGLGETSATATAITLSATGGVGTDKAGGNFTLAGGQPSGSGTPGYVYVSTADVGATGTTLRALVQRTRHTSTYFESLTSGSFAMPFAAGSATAPTYSFLGDTNTGIYSDTADVVQVTTGGTKRLDVDAVGNIRAYTLHDNATAQGSATQQDIRSGTYTPTLTGVTNVSSTTARKCQWMRVGNVVTVSGQMEVTATANNAQTTLGISLPVSSNFGTAYECGGAGYTKGNTVAGHGASIYADATNNRAEMDYFETHGAADTFAFNFTYEVI